MKSENEIKKLTELLDQFNPQADSQLLPLESTSVEIKELHNKINEIIQSVSEKDNALKAILKYSPALISMKDLEGKITLVNERFNVLDGPPPQEFVGQSLFDLFPKDIADALWENDLKAQNGVVEVEEKVAHKGGKLHDYLTVKFPIVDKTGKLTNTCAISTDITDRKIAERQLFESNAQLRLIAENIENVIWVRKYPELDIIYTNNKAESIWNLKSSNMNSCHQMLYDSIYDKDKKEFKKAFSEFSEQGKLNIVYRINNSDGTLKWIHDRGFPIFSQDGQLEFIVGIAQDITSEKLKQDDLYNLQHDLEEQVLKRTFLLEKSQQEALDYAEKAKKASNAKSEFLANMSHEIRTPMNAILGFADILERRLTDPQDIEYLQSVNSSGQLLLRLINDILDLSKVEVGKLDIRKSSVNLSLFMEQFDKIFSKKIKDKKLQFSIKITPGVPACLHLDEARLRQIIFNIVGNAIKFTKKGKVEVKIDYLDNNDKTVDLTIDVTDSGIGVAEDQQKLIFDPFQQVEGQDFDLYGGTGLGLAICKKLVHLMDGSLTLKSQINQGATFTINLPAVEVIMLNQIEIKEVDVNKYRFEKAKILIVDDISFNRDLLKSFIKKYKFEIDMAANGIEAIEKVKNFEPDLILMDIKMPKLNGIDASRQIQEITTCPIIAISASPMKTQTLSITKLCQSYLIKPIKHNVLIREMALYLKHSYEDLSGMTSGAIATPTVNLKQITELIQILQNGFTEPIKEATETLTVNHIREVTNKLTKLAESYPEPIFKTWVTHLQEDFSVYDMLGVERQLHRFNKIIEQLSTIVKNG